MRGFLFLGLFVGLMIGMSRSSLSSTTIPLLFAFGGGTAIALFGKNNAETQKLAERHIFALSLGAMIGLFAGIFLAENRLLTLNDYPKEVTNANPKYLNSEAITDIDSISQQLRNGKITTNQAFEEIMHIYKSK